MLFNKSIICVIPARLDSKRFPRKMLATLQGKPLLQKTYESALQVPIFDKVIIAVDSKELQEKVISFGGEAILTSSSCTSGTDRLIELHQSGKSSGDIWVNWQGDEPFITGDMIEALLQSCDAEGEEIWTLKRKIENEEEIHSPHVVKVVSDAKGHALYFSRSPIPYQRDDSQKKTFYKHIGIYAFSNQALKKMAHLSPCPLEKEEKLEQLRFLYHGMQIKVHETSKEVFGIDTKEELLLAERL